MNVAEFVAKWKGATRSERAASQEHFIDLCNLLGAPTPNKDPTGEDYAFEKGAEKTGGCGGFADVWKRCCFVFFVTRQATCGVEWGDRTSRATRQDVPPRVREGSALWS